MSHPPPPGGQHGAGSFIKRHKAATIGAALLAGVGVFALYERSKNGASSASSDTTTPASASTYDDTGDYASLESQLANLQSATSRNQTEERDQSRTNQRQWKRIDQLGKKRKPAKKSTKRPSKTKTG